MITSGWVVIYQGDKKQMDGLKDVDDGDDGEPAPRLSRHL
jgi:hypothetical protein